jgi:hypothetical protein
MTKRFAQGYELEAYLVFSQPLPLDAVVNPLPALKLEVYPLDETHARAIRLSGDIDEAQVLSGLRGLLGDNVRWLEVGWRGYGLIDGKREYRPWRRNAHLGFEVFMALETLEPEVRYHTPS